MMWSSSKKSQVFFWIWWDENKIFWHNNNKYLQKLEGLWNFVKKAEKNSDYLTLRWHTMTLVMIEFQEKLLWICIANYEEVVMGNGRAKLLKQILYQVFKFAKKVFVYKSLLEPQQLGKIWEFYFHITSCSPLIGKENGKYYIGN